MYKSASNPCPIGRYFSRLPSNSTSVFQPILDRCPTGRHVFTPGNAGSLLHKCLDDERGVYMEREDLPV
jgi:hypothetical protein